MKQRELTTERGELAMTSALHAEAQWRGVAAAFLVLAVSWLWGWYCRLRIGGITGDTLGASVEISEALVLLAGLG